MKNVDDMSEVAGLAEKVLPGQAVPAAGAQLPAHERATADPPLRTEPSATTPAASSAAAVVTGVVQAVELRDGAPKIVVDGTAYDLSQVLTITPTPVNPSSTRRRT